MNAIVTVIWQEIPESTKIFSIVTKDQAEYDLLMSFHNKFIGVTDDTDDLFNYFYDSENALRFIDEGEKCPIEMLGIDGVKFAVICTGIYL